jgi:hypothetical protein
VRLDRICAQLGVDFFDLARLGRAEAGAEQTQLSLAQEEALAADVKLFICFYAVMKGFGALQIAERYAFSLADTEKALRRAERLGLVSIGAKGRVRLRVPRYVEWIEDGPLARLYEAHMRVDFLDADKGRFELLKFVTGTISERSRQVIARKVRLLLAEIREMTQMDAILDPHGVAQTMTLLVGLREWTPAVITKHRRSKPAP